MPPSLHLNVLPPAQRTLWSELSQLPDTFVLYEGTAIALQLGHRTSVDFDFFTAHPIHSQSLAEATPFLRSVVTVRQEPGTWIARIDRQGPVQMSFLSVPFLLQLQSPIRPADGGCRIASLLDLAAAKASVVQRRLRSAVQAVNLDALPALQLAPREIGS